MKICGRPPPPRLYRRHYHNTKQTNTLSFSKQVFEYDIPPSPGIDAPGTPTGEKVEVSLFNHRNPDREIGNLDAPALTNDHYWCGRPQRGERGGATWVSPVITVRFHGLDRYRDSSRTSFFVFFQQFR